jgi:Phage integrase family
VAFAATLPKDASHCPTLPAVTANDLRRTFASLLVQAGTPLDVVARLLRHTSTAMVYRVYGQHTTESLEKLVGAPVEGVRVLYRTPKSPEENTDNLGESRGPRISRAKRLKPGIRSGIRVGRAGHDPATYGLKVRSSTN